MSADGTRRRTARVSLVSGRGRWAVRADRMVVGGRMRSGGHVLIEGDRITAVGGAPDTGIQEVRIDGGTIVPGLVDSHVHMGLDATPEGMSRLAEPEHVEAMRSTVGDRADAMARAGVAAYRDLGAPADWAASDHGVGSAHGGERVAPVAVVCGVPLTRPGGHAAVMGGAVRSAADVRRLVRRNHDLGARWIKVMVSGGFTSGTGSPWALQFSAEDLRDVVTAAERLGLPVAAHAHTAEAVWAAVSAGVTSVEHCSFMTADGFDRDPELVAALARSGTVVSPTVNSAAPAARGRLPWDVRAGQIRALYAAGVRLVAGTDAGIPGCAHDDLPAALAVLASSGIPPLDVLEMATGRAADVLNAPTVVGRLCAGARADLMVVPGDPAEGLAGLASPALVVSGGAVVLAPRRRAEGADGPDSVPGGIDP